MPWFLYDLLTGILLPVIAWQVRGSPQLRRAPPVEKANTRVERLGQAGVLVSNSNTR